MDKKNNISVIKDLLNFPTGPFDKTIKYLNWEKEKMITFYEKEYDNLTPFQQYEFLSHVENARVALELRVMIQEAVIKSISEKKKELILDLKGQKNLDILLLIVRELGAEGYATRLENFEKLIVSLDGK